MPRRAAAELTLDAETVRRLDLAGQDAGAVAVG
jgi:hypothetical protein